MDNETVKKSGSLEGQKTLEQRGDQKGKVIKARKRKMLIKIGEDKKERRSQKSSLGGNTESK